MSWEPPSIEAVIEHIDSTDEDAWCTSVVRTDDGRNCFFGHLFNMGADDREGSRIWNWFESEWLTTYAMYPINDGENPRYPQSTPKQRCLAVLRALRDGEEETSWQSMDREFRETEGTA